MPYFVGQRSRHDRTDPIPVMHLYHSNSFVKFRWKMPSEIQIPNSNRRKDPGSEMINIDDRYIYSLIPGPGIKNFTYAKYSVKGRTHACQVKFSIVLL